MGDGPQGDYLPITSGELTGDLDVDGNITATGDVAIDGTATFSKGLELGSAGVLKLIKGGNGTGDTFTVDDDGTVRIGGTIPTDPNVLLATGGSAEFAGNVDIAGNAISGKEQGITLRSNGSIYAARTDFNTPVWRGYTVGSTDITSEILANGAASFAGDVVIGSRGSKWLIRESNGVAMLIEQTRRGQIEPRTQKVRDLPNELDLIEAALNEVMAKLKMTPPAGWPVWDGQSEVATDNDNA